MLTAGYTVAVLVELARGYRLEPTRGRVIALSLASIHFVACLGRISLIDHGAVKGWPLEAASNWIGIFVIEVIVNVVGFVIALITMERDRAEQEQFKAASTDVLTGTLNRRAFLDESTDWIERKGKDAALLLFDLDYFKRINDTYGHATGDAALITFAKLAGRRIEIANIIAGFNLDASTSDQYPRWYEATIADAAEGGKPLIGRLGGEEFACLLPHLSLVQGFAIAEDIRRELQDMDVCINGRKIPLSVSASVVTTADIGHRLNIMLSAADRALYVAKHNGRNRVEIAKSEWTTLKSRSA
jgi:GGDEF domain-containing protein